MNTPPVNIGIVTTSAASLASSNPKNSGDAFGSFALELNTLWHSTPDVSTTSEGSPSFNAENARRRVGEEDTSSAWGGIEQSVAGEAPHSASQNKGTPDSTSSVSIAERAPIAFVGRRAISSESFVSARNPRLCNLTGRTQTYSPEQLDLTRRPQLPTAYREYAEASRENHQGANASGVAPAIVTGLTEPGQQKVPADAQSAPSNIPTQPNLTGSDQAAMVDGQLSRPGPMSSGEPRTGAALQVRPSISSSAAREVTEEADFSQSQDDSAKQTAGTQAIASPAECLLNKPDADLAADPKLSQLSTVQPQVFVDGNADFNLGNLDATGPSSPGMSLDSLVAGAPGGFRAVVAHIDNSLDQAQSPSSTEAPQEGGQVQDNGGNLVLTPRALTGEPAFAREAAVPQAHPSDSAPFRSSAGDKSENSAPAGSSPDNNEAPSAPGNIQPARFVWMQAGGDYGSGSDQTSQNSPQDYSTDRSLDSSKNATFPGPVQKAGPPGSDTGSEMAIGLTEAVGRDSGAQGASGASSADSTDHAAPALQNWDGAMERLAQNVNSAHLTDAMGQSEIQVNMKSDSWGSVSVRATLSNGQVGAEIQVSDRDAHAVLTEGLHTLEKSLGENGIQLSNLDISHGLGYGHSQSHSQQEKQAGQPTDAARTFAYRSAVSAEPAASKTANTTDDLVLGRVSVHV